jgi:peptidyl-prolyl cis-trans isomerase-like 4
MSLYQNGRIAPDEELDETHGLSAVEIEERDRSREAHAQATILEIVGDLPDADMAPPENVLFVCKLNPVTTDDDLEIIFSRFGKVKRLVSDGLMVLSLLSHQDG